MATDSAFWSDLGPYAMAALGFMVAAAYMDLKRENRDRKKESKWFRNCIIKIVAKLGLELPEEE